MNKNLGLRKAVGIILARDDGKIWTGKRKIGIGVRPNEKNLWQMPQGGIDIGESPENAAYRELEEETGTTSAEIIFTLDEWLEYNLPSELIGKALGGKFGLRYGFMTKDSAQGSMNIPWNIEMYANFGIWGVLIGSVIVGIGLGTIDRIFNSPRASMTEGLIGSALVLPVFYQDSNLSVMMGTFVPLSICYWLYFRIGLTIPLRRP